MKLAIVGSRSFPQLDNVRWFVNELPEGIIVVSGGAHGVDTATTQAARRRGLSVVEYLPELDSLKGRHEYTKAYYARNQKIVDNSGLVIAFTGKNTGGIWATIFGVADHRVRIRRLALGKLSVAYLYLE